MNTPLRLAALAVAGSALLVGCTDSHPTSPDATSAPEQTATAAAADAPEATATTRPTGEPQPTGSAAASGSASPEPSQSTPTDQSTPTSQDGEDSEPQGLEMPVAPESSVTSLADLLSAPNDAPLVRAPLPRADSAVGRIVAAFPDLLRPSPRSPVRSSSISPAGDRLQVGLVASTSLAPEEVLLAYRSRLARRALIELATPITVPGSHAAAFRRGRSVITVTVTEEGSRTTYSVSASLHTGGE